jgi:hypothetical protein
MRSSKKLQELEAKVIQMEMTIELLSLAISNLMESQEMVLEDTGSLSILESSLDSGKWYKNTKQTP